MTAIRSIPADLAARQRRIENLLLEIDVAITARDELGAAAAHKELIDLEHQIRLGECAARVADRVAEAET